MNNHNILNTTNGLYVFGNNNFGQLGLGGADHFKDRNIPTKLNFLNETMAIISIKCTQSGTMINTTDGLYVFGRNDSGQLGLGDDENKSIPTKLKFEHKIISFSCGDDHTILHSDDGLYVFGFNFSGQLGLGDYEMREVPTKLIFFENFEIVSTHCGERHTIINTTDGLYVFGNNNCGQLGLGDEIDRNVPTKLNLESRTLEIQSIDCGLNYTIINTTNGLYVFGDNESGQLGLGHTNYINQKVPIKLQFKYKVISIHCGSMHTIINTDDGLYVFGRNYCGQLGLGDHYNRNVPTKLDFFKGIQPLTPKGQNSEIISIQCGRDHTLINTTDGLFVFGCNVNRELGLKGRNPANIPTKLDLGFEIILLEKKKIIKSAQSYL